MLFSRVQFNGLLISAAPQGTAPKSVHCYLHSGIEHPWDCPHPSVIFVQTLTSAQVWDVFKCFSSKSYLVQMCFQVKKWAFNDPFQFSTDTCIILYTLIVLWSRPNHSFSHTISYQDSNNRRHYLAAWCSIDSLWPRQPAVEESFTASILCISEVFTDRSMPRVP